MSEDHETTVREEIDPAEDHLDTIERMREAMPRRPLSRRALLRSAAIAPVLVAARNAFAEPSAANMATLAKVVPVPSAEVTYVRTQAAAAVPNLDVNLYEAVARTLWAHFCVGLGVIDPAGIGLFQHAYSVKNDAAGQDTGLIVAQNVKSGLFDPLGNDYLTNVCAHVCGHKAAQLALKDERCKLTVADYEAARKATEAEMRAKLSCARKLPQSGGGGPGLGGGC